MLRFGVWLTGHDRKLKWSVLDYGMIVLSLFGTFIFHTLQFAFLQLLNQPTLGSMQKHSSSCCPQLLKKEQKFA